MFKEIEKAILKSEGKISIVNIGIEKALKQLEECKCEMERTLEASDPEGYSEASIKMNSLNEYIEKAKNEIKKINENKFNESDYISAIKEAAAYHNNKLKKIEGELIKTIELAINKHDEFKKISKKYNEDKSQACVYQSQIKSNINISSYVQYNTVGYYSEPLDRLKNILNDRKKFY